MSNTNSFLVAPIVNLNGTSRKELTDQLHRAAFAVNAALEALYETSPHGRDYQCNPPGAWEAASSQHEVRCDSLRAVYVQLLAIHDAIEDSASRK